jgi:phosphohistidine phosphatase
MTTLYLVRHAVAAERGDEWPDDSQRPLTTRGAARFRDVVRGLASLGVTFDLILSSPLVRTRQTAEILSRGIPSGVTFIDALAPSGTPAAVISELSRHLRKQRVAFVGHEPNLGDLAARLIGARVPLPFKKGGVCRIDIEVLPPKGLGRLQWFAPPRMLRRLRD